MHTQQNHFRGRHALVIGASIAGLLAARVLSDYFEQVTVVERDPLLPNTQPRKGVPQGNHVHLLMIRGANILSECFPGIFSELEADGSEIISPTDDFHWFHFGCWKQQFPGHLRAHSQSRPLLEYHIRRRVAALPQIRILDHHEVLGLIGSAASHSAITGVRIRDCTHTQDEQEIETQLVVDASGRGSQTPRWLTELGYPPVEEEEIKVQVGYASRLYRRTEQRPHWKVLGIYPWPLERKRIGYIFPVEGNAWIVTLSGYLNDHPPADEAGFLAFAQSLARPDIYETIKDAEPLGPISIHKFPANRRRHYERLSPPPDGFVVLGDAACCLNPIYGQGMTVAAIETRILRDCLEQQVRSGTLTGFSRHFQRQQAKSVEIPWLFTTSEDFRYPVEGKRPFGLSLLQGYTQRVSRLTASDPFATQTFYEVLNMLKAPAALFHPRILLPALLSHQTAPTRERQLQTAPSP